MNEKPSYGPAIDSIEFAARAVDFARCELERLYHPEANRWQEIAGIDLQTENTRLYGLKRRLEHLANLVDAADLATSIEIAEITDNEDRKDG